MPARRPSSCTPSSKSRSPTRRRNSTTTSPRHRELCRGAHLLPGHRRVQSRPGRISRARPQGEGSSLDIPVIGSLNGMSTGGWIDYAKKIEEAGADALELNVYYIPTDPKLTAAEVEKIVHRGPEGGQDQRPDPRRDEAEPLLQLDGQHGRAAGCGGRRRAGAVQPVLPAGLRPREAGGGPHRHPEHAAGHPPPAALGRHPVRPGEGLPGGHQRRCTRAEDVAEDAHGGRGRDDDVLRPAAARPDACRDRPGGPAAVDAGARVRLRGADEGEHEPANRSPNRPPSSARTT